MAEEKRTLGAISRMVNKDVHIPSIQVSAAEQPSTIREILVRTREAAYATEMFACAALGKIKGEPPPSGDKTPPEPMGISALAEDIEQSVARLADKIQSINFRLA